MKKHKIVYKSLVWPLFEKCVSDPLFRFVPRWIPANIITLFGNFCLFLSAFAGYALRNGAVSRWVWPVVPALILIYCACDCWDGKQARRTNTSSPLGNFLDHYFDILVPMMIVPAFVFSYRIHDPLAVALIFIAVYLPLFATYFEQYYTGMMYFETIGAFEFIVIFIIFSSLGYYDAPRDFFTKARWHSFSLIHLALIASGIGSLGFFVKNICRSWARTKKWPLLFLLTLGAAAFFACRLFDPVVIVCAVGLYCASYTERFMLAYVKDKKAPLPDFLYPLLLALVFFFRDALQLPPRFAAAAAAAYQLLSMAALFVYGFVPLRKGWILVNPPAPKEPAPEAAPEAVPEALPEGGHV
ncbi:MAG: CDP-alcohol phosphatidyltransferase family protein [Treponema sp.]|jgi:ethanolaminephosphotransferase|nr:CDP-alcohol phosphatidyltransferase family protein [Treponema sp.]